MKKCVFVLMLVLATVASGSLHASEALKAIVGSYLDVQARLASDTLDGVKPAAHAIAEQAVKMGVPGDAIAKAAKSVEQAGDLAAAREAFGALSDAVVAAGDAEGWKDVPDVKVAYCPMVKRPWVQKEAAIRNPYFGAAMLTCGEFKKK